MAAPRRPSRVDVAGQDGVTVLDRRDVDLARGARGFRLDLRRLSPAAVRDLLLVGLTFSSGAIDAISFLALGKVFTAFMTGNLVFLGLGLADADGPDVVRVAVSLACFAGGVLAAGRIVGQPKPSSPWTRRVSVALGIAVLAQAAFLAGWLATSGRPATIAGDLLVSFYAAAMGLQSGAIFSLGVKGVFTTAATATVIVLATDVADPREAAAERRRLAGVLLGLVAGAAAGGALLVHAHALAPIVPLVATVLVIAVASVALRTPDSRESRPRPRA